MSPRRRSGGTMTSGTYDAGLPSIVRPQEEASRTATGSRSAGILLVLAGTVVILVMLGESLGSAAVGGAEGEELQGTESSETLAGRGGDDLIRGFAGDDGLAGGAGEDELYGGTGRDVLLGGAGDDVLEAKDGERDYLDCGAGPNDVASADEEDRVAGGCEVTYRD